jgi:DHA2 family multidrug resistance protein
MAKVFRLPLKLSGSLTHHPLIVICAIFIGPYMVAFNSRLFGLGLADLKGVFGLGFDEGAWLSTFATAPQMLMAPAVGWLAATFGVRRIIVSPALVYALVSALIPISQSFLALTALHVIHGLLLGVFVPATLMMIFRNLPTKWWIAAIAIYTFRNAFTTNSGAALLDIYVQHLGWQFLYWQDVLIAPLLACLVILGVPHEKVNHELLRRADWGGMILFGAGMALIYIAVDQGNRLDWFENGFVMAAFFGGVFLLAAFAINEMVVDNPWAHINAVGARNVTLMLSIALFYMMSSLSNTTLVPNFLVNVAGLRPEQIGVTLIAWVCIPLVIVTPLTVWAMHRIDGRIVLLVGLSCLAIASLLGTGLTSDWNGDNFRTICVLLAAGQALSFQAIVVVVISHGDPKMAIATGAYIQVVRLLGVEMAQALMTTFLRKSEQIHSFLTGLNVERGSEAASGAIASLTHKLSSSGEALAHGRATQIVAQSIQRQAVTLSYIDAFWLAFFCAVGALTILAFVSKAPAGPMTPK